MLARTDALSRLRTTLADSKQRADLVEQLQQAVPAAVLLGGSDAVDAAWRAVCHVARTWP